MGERYLVTGAQLGVLKAIQNEHTRNKIIDEIIDLQFISTSGCDIITDVNMIKKLL